MKSEVDKLDINKLVKIPTGLNNLKGKVDDSDVGKLKTIAKDLKKTSDVMDKEAFKNKKFNTLNMKLNNLEKTILDACTLIQTNHHNTEKQNLGEKTGFVEKKITDITGLATRVVLNTKISGVDNKIPDVTGLIKKTNYDVKVKYIEKKYFTTADYKKLMICKEKPKKLVNKSDISNLVKSSDLNTKFSTLATKAELKADQDKIVKLETRDSNFFLAKYFFGDDGFQNMFVYEPILDTLDLKKDKGTDYIFSWKSKVVYTSKLKSLYTAFLYSIKLWI